MTKYLVQYFNMRIILYFLLFISTSVFSQNNLEEILFEKHGQFEEQTIKHRRFKHSDIKPLILKLKNDPQFNVQLMRHSIEGREIYLISIGRGKTDVLLWSQMHGDEPTGTMAIMDIFNFFSEKNGFKKLKDLLKKELTLHFIPMLNPDGAEKYERRNANGVDLNRDALRLQNPESIILKKTRDSLEADWGFNLHDQSRYYSAGLNPKTASISFLAPAYNYEKEINKTRSNAMKLIGIIDSVLQKYIPGKTARYSDDFEPRAFGDNITKWGTSTILIESGGLENDREKQFLRKLHFVVLLKSFEAIANGGFNETDLSAYNALPFNKSNAFHDLILRKVNVERDGRNYILDIAFRNHEIEYENNSRYFFRSSITDIGDLSTLYSYKEMDVSEYKIETGKLFPKKIDNINELKKMDLFDQLKQGYTQYQIDNPPARFITDELPIVFSQHDAPFFNEINLGQNPSLLFYKKNKLELVLANGFFI